MRALLLIATALLGITAVAAQATATFSGKSVNAVTGEPIPGVKIELHPGFLTTTTDDQGRFTFEHLRADSYAISYEKEGFVKPASNSGPSLRLVEGERVTSYQLRIAPEAIISGRIQSLNSSFREPMLTLLRADRPVHVSIAKVQNGEFRFMGLAAGSYKLQIETHGGIDGASSRSFYPDKLTIEQAEVVTLRQGETRSGLVVTPLQVQSVSISGRYTGEIQPNRRLSLVIEEVVHSTLRAGVSGGGWLDPNGRFKVNVRPGAIRTKVLEFPQGPGQPLVLGWTDVTIAAANNPEIIVNPSPIRTVRAKFRVPPGVAIPTGEFSFGLNPMDRLGIMQWAKPAEGGWVVAPKVSPDRYSILIVSPASGVYIQSILAGGADITKSGLDLITGTVTDIEIVLATGAGSVTGTVGSAEKTPVSGARVFIAPITTHRPELELRAQNTVCDINGRFTLSNLAPGEYTISASDGTQRSPAQTIRIAASRTQQLQLTLP